MRYFGKQAMRLYGSAGSNSGPTVLELASRIKTGRLSDGFTVRDIYKNTSGLLSNQKVVDEAVEELVHANWLRRQDTKRPGVGGRPTVKYYINPSVVADKAA